MMAEIERTKQFALDVPFEDTAQRITYDTLMLRAPTLSQAEQFYEKQSATNSLAAMRLLISLTAGGIPESVLSKMDFLDFRKCEEYLLTFLTWSASASGRSGPQT
ncbi:phage tail assembly protein [Cedecea neteri]|uniref:phage tail assembly protein n=1 Tax=Cedecea neteri TaxID=158822 RepID=UPI002AA78541|nr:phage tail assembly protein [Cedecea neteri]WPU25002.1 phage tail assembly protein [Cedecea neteri]